MNDIVFSDLPFIIEAIIESDKSGTERLSYSTIFGLSEKEVRKYLSEMLLEEIKGCGELSLSSYLVAERKGELIGTICAWIEADNQMASAVLKGNLLLYTIPKKAIEKALEINNLINELQFSYRPKTIIFRTAFVTKDNRGFNLGGILKEKIILNLIKNRPEIREVYVDTFVCSKASLRTNEKLGFEVVEIKESKNPDILNYLPSNKKVLMKKVLK